VRIVVKLLQRSALIPELWYTVCLDDFNKCLRRQEA